MRCPKCGYNSFDYLSHCKKCNADLTGIRQELGMLHVKPTNPFLLGALLKEGTKPQAVDGQSSEEVSAFAGFEELRPDSGENTADLFSMESRETVDEIPAAFHEEPETSPSPGAPSDSSDTTDLSIELTDELADWSFLDEAMDETLTPQPADAKSVDDRSGQIDDPSTQARRRTKEADDHIIELSEEDLEGLFIDLNDTDSEKDGTDKSQ
ncbi:hypothetical protein [Desulfoferrobacter suflitae]|uniref:hypothetical protein n=1 Tax=Desulfoferrobacter suflitae TaxID=2865782 RepID=UPI002164BB50|nr:hypothetical protein [Desulfoferrobacter suflitae]MCK8602001.1 hypothetical protein [Desulfoferrobacter suflitae]